MKMIGALIVLATACVVGSASDCRRVAVVTHAPAYHAPAYSYYAPAAAAVSYYPVGYAPDNTEAFLKLFEAYRAKSEEHTALLKAMIASGSVPPELKALAAPPHPGAVLERTDCMRCHDASVSAAKGGKRTFFRDGAFVGTPEDEDAMLAAVEAGTMPKDRRGGWSDKERFQWLSYAARRPRDAAPKVDAPPKASVPEKKTVAPLGVGVVFRDR